jgi:hypothetical protein
MSTSTGQPSTQLGFLHWRQRPASIMAVSAVYPVGTSAKFFRRTSGACSGMACLETFSFFTRFSGMGCSYSSIMQNSS